MRFLENVLAVIGLVSILGFAAYGVLALEKDTQPQTPRMTYPVQYDASMCQRGAAPDKWKCRVYTRSDK